MHPVTRVVLVIATTALLAGGSPYVLLGATALSVGLHWWARCRPGPAFVPMLARLRWFFVSLLVLYAWFTPGRALVPALGVYSPTLAGAAQGLLRCAILIVILSLVHWLTATTSRTQLVQAIYWLCRPLRVVGLRGERLAVRLVLVLEQAPLLRATLAQVPDRGVTGRWERVVERARAAFQAALEAGERAPETTLELDIGQAPGGGAWLLLATLVLALAGLAYL